MILKLTPLTEDPRYVEAASRLNALASAHTKVESRIAEIEAGLSVRLDAPSDSSARRVEAALSFAATGTLVAPVPAVDGLNEERHVLLGQRDALRTAVLEQRSRVETIAREISREVSTQHEARHNALGKRMLAALLEVDRVQQEDMQLEAEFGRAGYEPTFAGRLSWPLLGMISQGSESSLWHRVRELGRYSH